MTARQTRLGHSTTLSVPPRRFRRGLNIELVGLFEQIVQRRAVKGGAARSGGLHRSSVARLSVIQGQRCAYIAPRAFPRCA